MKIITNHHWRRTYDSFFPSPEEWKELSFQGETRENCDDIFFPYKGRVYRMKDFSFPGQFFDQKWDGILSDSFFSGILVKFNPEDATYIKVARFVA